MIDEICRQICSVCRDWTDINRVLDILRKFLTDEEVEVFLNFLVKYFLEMNEGGKKVRLKDEFLNLYKET